MFRAALHRGLDKNRLRVLLALLFLALLVPTLILIYQAYSRLKWEAFHQHRVMAEELAARVDGRLAGLIDGEEARSFADYAFLVVAGDPAANFFQPSPLSGYPVASGIPGLLGYFQVDAQGGFSTPLLPQAGVEAGAYGISADEYGRRLALQQRIREVLSENRLLRARRADGLETRRGLEIAELESMPADSRDRLNAEANGSYQVFTGLMYTGVLVFIVGVVQKI